MRRNLTKKIGEEMAFPVMRFGAMLVCTVCLYVAPVAAMDMRVLAQGLPVRVELEGPIEKGDASRISRELDTLKPSQLLAQLQVTAPLSLYDPRQWLWIKVDSDGGSLDDAMELGRYFRAANALIEPENHCSSGCVFLLAGAVERIGRHAPNTLVGIHRPYPAEALSDSEAGIAKFFEELHARVAGYLHDMRLSTELGDAIFAYAPEDEHALAGDELDRLLPERDPVWDESTIARRARILGLTAISLRQKQIAVGSCGDAGWRQVNEILASMSCLQSSNPGMPIDDIAAQKMLFGGQCARVYSSYYLKRPGNADFVSCAQEFSIPVLIGQR